MSIQRITLMLLAITSITLLGSPTAEAQRNTFRDIIREGANQILNNGQGNVPSQPPGGVQPQMRSLAPSESGRDSGGGGFDRTDGGGGWIPVQPSPNPTPTATVSAPTPAISTSTLPAGSLSLRNVS